MYISPPTHPPLSIKSNCSLTWSVSATDYLRGMDNVRVKRPMEQCVCIVRMQYLKPVLKRMHQLSCNIMYAV